MTNTQLTLKKERRTLVTGCTGLLGSEILRSSPASVGVNSQDCNLLSPYPCDSFFYQIKKASEASGSPIDTVIHCAAKVGGVQANTNQVAEFFDDNIRMNLNIIESCKRAEVKLVSVLSTCIYPDAPCVEYPLTEDQLHMGPPHPSNFGYAYAKRMLEVQSRAYRQQFGCNFISVIPNNLYGINDNYDLESGHVIPALIRKFYMAKFHGLEFVDVWGTGKPLREFTFARDAAKIVLWLAENYDGAEPVNIGNPEQVSIWELAQIISEEVGYKGVYGFDKSMPDGQLKKPSSNEKLRKLGWNGEYTPLREGLRETIKFFEGNYPNVRGI
jgi:GDP-L-fucose synthase